MLKQPRSEAAQLFGVELIERRSRNHGDDSARSADRCMSFMSFNGYGWLRQPQAIAREDRPPVPGADQYLAPFGRHADYSARRIFLNADGVPPAKRPSRRAPTLSCGCLGDWQRGRRRLRRTEDRHDSCEGFLGAGAHIHRLGGQPNCVDADHKESPRTKRTHPSGSEDGHFTVMVCSPNGSSMITDDSTCLFGATFRLGDISRPIASLRFEPRLSVQIWQVERAGVLLAQECVRPGGRRGCGDKAEIGVEIEVLLRAELLSLLDCDWLGEETGHILTGYLFCWVVDPNAGTSDFLRGLKG